MNFQRGGQIIEKAKVKFVKRIIMDGNFFGKSSSYRKEGNN